jgi:hypothetical protein
MEEQIIPLGKQVGIDPPITTFLSVYHANIR